MAQINFGGVNETVVTREEFPLEKARKVLENETIAVIGYGVQGPGQSLNLRDNGFNVIVGQREGTRSWERAVADGWVPGQTLFGIEEAAERGTIIQYLLSDAGQIAVWPALRKHLTAGKALYFSHGFGITYKERTGIVPPADVDVILIAPKGSGTSLRRMFLEGRGLNSSFAVFQDATGRAFERVVALGIGVGSGYLFETDFKREVYSDLTHTATPPRRPSTRRSRSSRSRSCRSWPKTAWTGCTPTARPRRSAARSTGGNASETLRNPSSNSSTKRWPPVARHSGRST